MQNKIDDVAINFQNITIQAIGDSSGIFIGKNNAMGWSAHSKSNQGLGSSNGNVVQNVILVYDNDLVDSPVDACNMILDNDTYCLSEVKETAHITFEEINVNSLTNNATVSVGNNKQNRWSAYNKANTGINDGRITSNNINTINDADIIDSPAIDQNLQTK